MSNRIADEYRLIRTRDEEGPIFVIGTKVRDGPQTEHDLAAIRDPEAGAIRRLMRFILADEGPTQGGAAPVRLHPLHFVWRPRMAVTWEAPVAVVERIDLRQPGATPGAIGHHLVGVAEFTDSVLATVIFRAVRGGLLNAISAAILTDEPVPEGGAPYTRGRFARLRFHRGGRVGETHAYPARGAGEPGGGVGILLLVPGHPSRRAVMSEARVQVGVEGAGAGDHPEELLGLISTIEAGEWNLAAEVEAEG